MEIAELYNAGAISKRTMLERMQIVKDVDEELERMEQEKPNLETTDETNNLDLKV